MTFAVVTDSAPMGPQSLLGLFDSHRSGSSPVVRTSSPSLWSSLSGSEIRARAAELAAAFREYGFERGRCIAILADAGPDAIVAILAAVRAGGTALVIDPGIPGDDLVSVMVGRNAVQAVAGDEAQLRRLLEIRADLPDLELVLVARPDPSDRPTPALQLEAACIAGAEILERDPSPLDMRVVDPAIETAGSKGRGTRWSESDLLREAERIASELGLASTDTVLARFPADEAELAPLAIACLLRGATLEFADPQERLTFAAIGQSRATIAAIGSRDLETLRLSIAETGSSRSWAGRKLHAWAIERGRNRASHPRTHRIAEQLVLRRLREPAGRQLRLIQVFGGPAATQSIATLTAVGFNVQTPQGT